MGRPACGLDEYLEWQERLKGKRKSGPSVDLFCLQEDISKSTFYRWDKALKDGIPEPMLEEQADREQSESGGGHFVPITIKATSVEIELPNGGRHS